MNSNPYLQNINPAVFTKHPSSNEEGCPRPSRGRGGAKSCPGTGNPESPTTPVVAIGHDIPSLSKESGKTGSRGLGIIAQYLALVLVGFSLCGYAQERDRQGLAKELEQIARVATTMVDGDLCQRIMTERALQKMFTVDPKDPWAGADNFDVNAEPYIQTKKSLIRLARLADYPVDCNLWMPFKEEPGKIQVLIRNKYEMSQFWRFGQLFMDIPPEMKEVFSSGKPLTVQKRGNIVSVLAPVYNSLGDIVGLVEVVSRAQFNPQENVK